MPYNTTAIPPRKEVTGQTLLPLTRVKKIIAVDPDINVCSNNAAFVITLAAEMFVQYLAAEAQNMTKLDRKPRRNIQYKDLANAVAAHDNLEFLEDIIPKTVPYKDIKIKAAATRAKLATEKMDGMAAAVDDRSTDGMSNGKKHKSIINGTTNGYSRSHVFSPDASDPSAQLQREMRQAQHSHDGDVDMTG